MVGILIGIVRKEQLEKTQDNRYKQENIVRKGNRVLFSQSKLSKLENGRLIIHDPDEYAFLIDQLGFQYCDYTRASLVYNDFIIEYLSVLEYGNYSQLRKLNVMFEKSFSDFDDYFYTQNLNQLIRLSLSYHLEGKLPNSITIKELISQLKACPNNYKILILELVYFSFELFGYDFIDLEKFAEWINSFQSDQLLFISIKLLYSTRLGKQSNIYNILSSVYQDSLSELMRFRILRIRWFLKMIDVNEFEHQISLYNENSIPSYELKFAQLSLGIHYFKSKNYQECVHVFEELIRIDQYYAIHCLPYMYDACNHSQDSKPINYALYQANQHIEFFGQFYQLNYKFYYKLFNNLEYAEFEAFMRKDLFPIYRKVQDNSLLRDILEKYVIEHINKTKHYSLLFYYEISSKNIDLNFDVFSMFYDRYSKTRIS